MASFKQITDLLVKIGGPNLTDPIRAITNNYWTSGSLSEPVLLTSSLNNLNFVEKVVKINETIEIPTADSANKYNTIKEKFYIRINDSKVYDFVRQFSNGEEVIQSYRYNPIRLVENFSEDLANSIMSASYVSGTTVSIKYLEHSNLAKSPLNLKTTPEANGAGRSMYYNYDFSYNSYNQLYESVIQSKNISERLLPNIYYLNDYNSNLQVENRTAENDYVTKFVSLYDSVSSELVGQPFYFSDWVTKFISNDYYSILDVKNLNLLFGSKESLLDTNQQSENMPMLNTIEFSTDLGNLGIQNAIEESEAFCNIQNNIIKITRLADTRNIKLPFVNFSSLLTTGTNLNYSLTDNESYAAVELYNLVSSSITVEDEYFSRTTIPVSTYNLLYPDVPVTSSGASRYSIIKNFEDCETLDSPLEKYLTYIIMLSKLKNVANSVYRDYNDILNGNLSELETVCYKVNKYEILNTGNKYIQSFIIPNYNALETIKFFDSQIKYGKNYFYEIKAIKAVVGSEYTIKRVYRDADTETSYTACNIIFETELKPRLDLLEFPYATDSLLCVDTPPLTPQVQIVNFRDNERNVMFLFNSQVGKVEQEPIFINVNDEAKFSNVRTNQRRENGPIIFSSDDPLKSFEIFRLETKPTKYLDFSLARKIVVLPISNSTSTTYMDTILPNKKYYYTFRGVDAHGLISNPSYVYEIELVSDSGFVYLNKKIINILEEDASKINRTKDFYRFLTIKPSVFQKFINPPSNITDSANSIGEIQLGDAEDKVWNKTFKLRIKSKNTGKILDLNIKFNKTYVELEDET